MGKQVISISPAGVVGSLQHKQGKGVDLRKLGKATIKRATLIEWNEPQQRWGIRWMVNGVIRGARWHHSAFARAGVDYTEYGGVCEVSQLVYFAEYDDAVKAEVAVIQALQLSGKYNFTGSGVSV